MKKDIELSIVVLILSTFKFNRPTRLILTMSFLKHGLNQFYYSVNSLKKRI